MPTSTLSVNKASAGKNSNVTWNGGNIWEECKTYFDTVNILTADVARTAASGTLGIATTGVATFSADQTGIIAAGDYIVVGGAKYTIVSGATTSWVVTPPPTTAIATSTAYTPVNVGSYCDFPSVAMPGVHPEPERFRIRFGGTGTLSVTLQFVRVNATTGVETAITTAVATTAAALWQGVAAVATGQTQFTSSQFLPDGVTQAELPVDEFIRLVITAKTTTTTGRTLLVEMGLRRKTGATNYSS